MNIGKFKEIVSTWENSEENFKLFRVWVENCYNSYKKNYDLENAHDSYSYRVGSTVTAYLANGRMYANEEGVRNATPQGTAYFAALIASFVMFFVTLILWSKAAEKKRAGKR